MKKLLALLVLSLAGLAHADTILFTTAAGSTVGGQPVSASALFNVTSAGHLTVTLTNLQANPTSAVQNLSDFLFSFGSNSGVSGGALTSSTANLINIAGNGSVTGAGTGVSTGWQLNTSGGLFHVHVLGTPAGPAQTIVGPGPYTNCNGSICGNGPHNPFINQTATFNFTFTGLTSVNQLNLRTMSFSFGTTEGNDVPGIPHTSVPEPASLALLGTGLLGAGGFVRRKLVG